VLKNGFIQIDAMSVYGYLELVFFDLEYTTIGSNSS